TRASIGASRTKARLQSPASHWLAIQAAADSFHPSDMQAVMPAAPEPRYMPWLDTAPCGRAGSLEYAVDLVGLQGFQLADRDHIGAGGEVADPPPLGIAQQHDPCRHAA